MCRLSRNPGVLTSGTPQGHVGLFRGYFTFYIVTLVQYFLQVLRFCPSQYHSSCVPSSQQFISRSKPGGIEIFHTPPDWPWKSHSLVTVGYWISFPGLKRPKLGFDHPPVLAPRLRECASKYRNAKTNRDERERATRRGHWALNLPGC
jgi:hypothetical protein